MMNSSRKKLKFEGKKENEQPKSGDDFDRLINIAVAYKDKEFRVETFARNSIGALEVLLDEYLPNLKWENFNFTLDGNILKKGTLIKDHPIKDGSKLILVKASHFKQSDEVIEVIIVTSWSNWSLEFDDKIEQDALLKKISIRKAEAPNYLTFDHEGKPIKENLFPVLKAFDEYHRRLYMVDKTKEILLKITTAELEDHFIVIKRSSSTSDIQSRLGELLMLPKDKIELFEDDKKIDEHTFKNLDKMVFTLNLSLEEEDSNRIQSLLDLLSDVYDLTSKFIIQMDTEWAKKFDYSQVAMISQDLFENITMIKARFKTLKIPYITEFDSLPISRTKVYLLKFLIFHYFRMITSMQTLTTKMKDILFNKEKENEKEEEDEKEEEKGLSNQEDDDLKGLVLVATVFRDKSYKEILFKKINKCLQNNELLGLIHLITWLISLRVSLSEQQLLVPLRHIKESNPSLYIHLKDSPLFKETINFLIKLFKITTQRKSSIFNVFEEYSSIKGKRKTMKDMELLFQIIDLLPQRVFIIPSNRHYSALTLIDGSTGVAEDYIQVSLNHVNKVRLAILILHELGHKIRFMYQANKVYFKQTPESYGKEAGYHLQNLVFGIKENVLGFIHQINSLELLRGVNWCQKDKKAKKKLSDTITMRPIMMQKEDGSRNSDQNNSILVTPDQRNKSQLNESLIIYSAIENLKGCRFEEEEPDLCGMYLFHLDNSRRVSEILQDLVE